MHLFEYSEITLSIPSNIVDSMLEIERIRAFDRARMKHYAEELQSAHRSVVVDDTVASMSLCGKEVTRDRSNILYTAGRPETDAETEAEGYMNALKELSESDSPQLDEILLLQMHRTITNGTTRRESRFRYRQSQDISADPHARAVAPIPSDDVESSVHQMVESYRMAFDVGVQPILLIPCMVLDLLNIRPFTEANWRISRTVMRSLLASSGYPALRYVPLDCFIAEDPESYYESVSDSSEGWRKNANDPYPFVEFAVNIVLKSYREFETRYPLYDGRKMKKADRVCNLLESEPGKTLSKREICARLPDIGVRTADKIMADLLSEGRIIKTGTFKDAAYRSERGRSP